MGSRGFTGRHGETRPDHMMGGKYLWPFAGPWSPYTVVSSAHNQVTKHRAKKKRRQRDAALSQAE